MISNILDTVSVSEFFIREYFFYAIDRALKPVEVALLKTVHLIS